MKSIKEISKTSLVIILSALFVFTIANAGQLNPPSTNINSQGYTLKDIYTKLMTNTNAVSGGHSLSTTSMPGTTLVTLTQIYNLIPTIDASKVLVGNTYLGVSGTAPDYKYYLHGPYVYSNGIIIDQNSGLKWQNGDGGKRCWDNHASEYLPSCNPNLFSPPSGAVEYCQNLNLGGYSSGWRLASINDWRTVIDYSPPFTDQEMTDLPNTKADGYWSSDRYMYSPSVSSWFIEMRYGEIMATSPTNQILTRCVHD